MTRAHRREDRHRVEERRVAPRPRFEELEQSAAVPLPKIVNPYAVIALVAALLGLFPVAIVFGLIAFSYPGGRAKATFALLLGLAEVAAVVGLVAMRHKVVDRVDSAFNITTSSAAATTASTQAAPPVPAAPVPPPPPGTVQLAGSYQRAGGGTLKVTDGSGGSENFDLSVQSQSGGQPNYGTASGNLTVVGNRATYQSPYGTCQLVFQFAGASVTVTQTAQSSSACGFGANVDAGGQYLRK